MSDSLESTRFSWRLLRKRGAIVPLPPTGGAIPDEDSFATLQWCINDSSNIHTVPCRPSITIKIMRRPNAKESFVCRTGTGKVFGGLG